MMRAFSLLILGVLLAPAAAAHLEMLPARDPVPPFPVTDGAQGPPTPVAAPGEQHESAADGYQVEFRCPPTSNGTVPLTCPWVIFDKEDIMGQPRLLVDPEELELVGFNALHGGHGLDPNPAQKPPSDRSRDNLVHQPHTTFRATDGAFNWNEPTEQIADWEDNPYYSPLCDLSDQGLTDRLTEPLPCTQKPLYGEDNAATVDAQGRVYLASLYAQADSDADTTYTYSIVAWKGRSLDRAFDYNVNKKTFKAEHADNVIDNVHLVYVPGTDTVVLLWRESTPAGLLGGDPLGTGLRSWIGFAWTTTRSDGVWSQMKKDQAIGPCRNITNPVAYESTLYVGCIADEGYAYEPVEPGRVAIHKILVPEGRAEFLEATPVVADNAQMTVRSDGSTALVGTRLLGPRDGRVLVSWGDLGGDWTSPDDRFKDFTNTTAPLNTAEQLRSIRIQALAYREQTGVLHAIYQERYVRGLEDPDRLVLPEFYKGVVAVADHGAVLFSQDLGIGVTRPLYSANLQGIGDGVFDDLHDSFVVLRDPRSGDEREFVAFGDFGQIRFAEVLEKNTEGILPFAPQTGVQPIANPQATTAPSSNPYLVGVAGGVLASAMVLRLLLARRKHALEAPTLGGK